MPRSITLEADDDVIAAFERGLGAAKADRNPFHDMTLSRRPMNRALATAWDAGRSFQSALAYRRQERG